MYKCEPCDRGFGTSNGLTIHERGGPHKKRLKELSVETTESKEPIVCDIASVHDPNIASITRSQGDLQLVNIIKDKIGITNMNPQQLNLLINMLIASLKADINAAEYPVSASDLSISLGYTRSRKFIEFIIDNFDEKTDYKIAAPSGAANEKSELSLTIGCAKEACMISKKPNAKIVRKYFIVMEKLVKDYIRNPNNSALSFLHAEVVKRIPEVVNPCLIHTESYTREAIAVRESDGKDVVYIFQIHAPDTPNKRVYTYGITYKFADRGKQHRARYKCDCTLVQSWTTDVPRSTISRFETSIGHFAGNIGTREKYMDSRETFVTEEGDATSLPAIIAFISDTIPIQDVNNITYELERMKLVNLENARRDDHEYRMRKLELRVSNNQNESADGPRRVE